MAGVPFDHGIGHLPRGESHARCVDRLVVHGPPIDFATLARRAIPSDTTHLVLDLDRTTHLGRNLGELLGWELAGWHAYGDAHAAAHDHRHPLGRFWLDPRRPLAAAGYLLRAIRVWAHPGLRYLFHGRLAPRTLAGRRRRARRYGAQPMRAIQRHPQTALLSQIAALPPGVAATLARRVWDRHAPDQVITRDDLDALRARIPGLVIVLSSASPRATVEAAAQALGVDDALWSTVEDHAGRATASYRQHRLDLQPRPERIGDPAAEIINAGVAKIERLRARHPAMFAPGARVVGISDTGHGEDHCWVEHFARVIDVNAVDPYSPIVPAGAPIEEIHSAHLLTARERERHAAGDPEWLDPRRDPAVRAARHRVFDAAALDAALGPHRDAIEAHAADLAAAHAAVAPALDALAARHAALIAEIAATVRAHNAGDRRALARLRRQIRLEDALAAQAAAIGEPVALARLEIETLRADARRALDPSPRAISPPATARRAPPAPAPPAPAPSAHRGSTS
ncbi:MAG: hypothetical protein R3F65_28130 [bacterium]